ncbi:MAG: tetratricopeptide repeat protein [Bacteroidia bacterium]|nr:tetratricopeptide repeat protein [Bacteroidia bacterium]
MAVRIFTILICLSAPFATFCQQNGEYDDYFAGLASLEYKNYDHAIGDFTKALETNKNEYSVYLNRAESYYSLHKFDLAITDFRKADQLRPGVATYRIACCYAALGNTKEATASLETHLRSEYKLPESKIKLDKSFTGIENSAEWKNLWLNDWYNKQEQALADANYLLSNKKYNDALETLDNLLSQKKKFSEGYYLRAKVFELLNDDKNALTDYSEAINNNKNNPGYYIDRAKLYIRLEKYQQALADLNKALDLEPLNIHLYPDIAMVQSKMKEYKKAIVNLELYLKFFDHDDACLCQAGVCRFDLQQYDAAIEYFNQALELNKGVAKYYNSRAYAYSMKNDYKDAENDFSMSLDLLPKDATVYYGRGMVRLLLEKKNDACKDFERAANLGNNDAVKQLEINCH